MKWTWVDLLGADPSSWLLSSGEPAAELVTLTRILGLPRTHPDAGGARKRLLADPGLDRLISSMPAWGTDTAAGSHAMREFTPNVMNLLGDMGICSGDDPRVDRIAAAMSEHQEDNGRFQSFGKGAHGSEGGPSGPVWGAVLCDSHAIVEVLMRFGLGEMPCVEKAIQRMSADLCCTAQGMGWPCVPHTVTGFRGPGRKADFCPQVTLEALRAFSALPASQRPPELLDAARTCVRAWRRRADERPYMFGHGCSFKVVKWPPFWYSVYQVLSTLARYPEVWRDPGADPEDRRAVAEMAACLIAYNFGSDGKVIPGSCYKGFEWMSIGRKKDPSPLATALLIVVLKQYEDIAEDIRSVDVLRLHSSKGGSGLAKPPKQARPAGPDYLP